MFGTLRPHRCSLAAPDKARHGRLYCGLCRTLGEDHGQVTRGLLSFDAVLVAAVADALQTESAPDATTRCPIVPVVHRPTLHHTAVPLRYAAAVQVLLADQWMADRAMDGQPVARWVRPWGSARVANAWRVLDELGAGHLRASLDGFEHTQKAAESLGGTTPDAARGPTRDALRVVFGAMASLTGGVPLGPNQVSVLEDLGGAVGSIVYLVDALEDLPRDLLSNNFNPCAVAAPVGGGFVACPDRVEQACVLLAEALDTAAACIESLPVTRNRALLHNTVVETQGRRARRAMATARRQVQSIPRADSSVGASIERVALAAMALVTVWMGAAPRAFAQAGKAGKAGSGGNADDGDTGGPGESSIDLVSETPSTDPQGIDAGGIWDCVDDLRDAAVSVAQAIADWVFCFAGLPEAVDKFCSGLGQCFGNCVEASCDVCTDTCQMCQGCDTACQGCGGGCDACSGCGKSCQGCGDCCQGGGSCPSCGGCGGCKGCSGGGCCHGGGGGGCCKGGGGACC